LTLVRALSVFENVALFQKDLPAVVPRHAILERMRLYTRRFRLAADPRMLARDLAVGDQQKVEILKQLVAGARVLILDEPTKVLAPQESVGLFDTIADMRAEGLGIVLITHKLREVLACADRIVVMRHGRVAGVVDRSQATEEKLLALMFGDAFVSPAKRPGRSIRQGGSADVVELVGVSTSGAGGGTPLRDLSMRLSAGEIVGVAGVSGNGQRELGDLILGLQQPGAGTKLMWGEDASRWSAGKVRRKGVAAIPDDPLALACVPSMTVLENLALGGGRRYRAGFGVDWPAVGADMRRSFGELAFSPPPFTAAAATLSGGNLQRVVLARELAHRPKLIVALYPTRGLDALGAATVRLLLDQARERGAAVLMVSEDLDELFEVCDRVVVLYRGAIAGEFGPARFSADAVGSCMVGASEGADAA
jgi:simple sugar transport system ATP-binding protein